MLYVEALTGNNRHIEYFNKICVPAKQMTKVNEAVDLINFSDPELVATENLGEMCSFFILLKAWY